MAWKLSAAHPIVIVKDAEAYTVNLSLLTGEGQMLDGQINMSPAQLEECHAKGVDEYVTTIVENLKLDLGDEEEPVSSIYADVKSALQSAIAQL